MIVRSFTFALASAVVLSLAACAADEEGGGGSGSDKPAEPSSPTTPGGESSSSSSSSSSSTSSSSTSESSSGGGGGTKAMGKDCTASSECAEGKCVRFTDNDGNERGFCSRVCTKAADCPEEGWECNLAPYTACVPARD